MGIVGWADYWVTMFHSKLTLLRRVAMPLFVYWWLAVSLSLVVLYP